MKSPRQPTLWTRLVGKAAALLLLAPALAAAAPGAASAADERIEPAVVSIEVTQQQTDWYSPWQSTRPVTSAGSGFIIAPGRIMTNAHVVSDARQIIVRRNEDNQPYFAKVEFIAHDSDLAILTVADKAFGRGVEPLKFGDLPSLRSAVRTYGYPAGGEKISRTEGVVSRIQFVTYLHSGADSHLAVQTDSAINPGNSGGPVVQEGRVIGVAFQTNTRLNDVGFFIPTPVVRRFLDDIKDGRYDGYGDIGVVTSNLVNPAYRRFLKLPPGRQGIVVDRVVPGSSADGVMRVDDVIMSIEGVPVLSDATINYHGYSLNYSQAVEQKQLGEPVHVALWRDGKPVKIRFPLRPFPNSGHMRNQFDAKAPYVVYAGLVFMELNREYLKTFGNYWQRADKHLLYEHFFADLEHPEPVGGVVVLARVLPHQINSAYTGMVNHIVSTINDRPVHTLKDVARALDGDKGPYQRLGLSPGKLVLVLGRDSAEKAQGEILQRYGIDQARYLP